MGTNWSKPKKIDDAAATFGGLDGLMPSRGEIPDHIEERWIDWQGDWFFYGLTCYPVPKHGIDRGVAMRHLSAIQGSWIPKHEHKRDAVAYLASLWFDSPDGEPIQRKGTKAEGAST
jgi:hypothetical protein